MESPECTPARSMCSMMPGISTSLAVADRVDLDLLALEVLVDQDRLALRQLRASADVAQQLRRVLDDLHRAAAEHVAGPHQHRVADLLAVASASSIVRMPAPGGCGMPSC